MGLEPFGSIWPARVVKHPRLRFLHFRSLNKLHEIERELEAEVRTVRKELEQKENERNKFEKVIEQKQKSLAGKKSPLKDAYGKADPDYLIDAYENWIVEAENDYSTSGNTNHPYIKFELLRIEIEGLQDTLILHEQELQKIRKKIRKSVKFSKK